MWGLKMRVFDSQKVLAVGQTSGSGGWVKKISLANDGRRWIADEFGSPKEERANRAPSFEEASLVWIFGHGVPAQKKSSGVRKCATHVWPENSGNFSDRQTIL